jgi:hypothetical protein
VYFLNHTSGVGEDIIVPRPQDSEILRTQPRIANFVARTGGMLATVNLDDQTCFKTDEINHVGANRKLSPE